MPAPFGNARTDFKSIKPTIAGRIGVRIEGMDKLLLNLSRLSKLPPEGATRVLQVLASEFLNSIAEFAPVDTGAYVRSWRIKEQRRDAITMAPMGMLPARPTIGGGQSVPISASKLAQMIEFGTSAHIIAPREKEKLLFRLKNGEDVITGKPVNHPGTKPRPHIRIALAETRRKAKGVTYAVATEYADYPKWKSDLTRAAQQRQDATGRTYLPTSAGVPRQTSKPNYPDQVVCQVRESGHVVRHVWSADSRRVANTPEE
jgi:hypothetical protein